MNLHYDWSMPLKCKTCVHNRFSRNPAIPGCIYSGRFIYPKEIGDGVDYFIYNAYMFIVYRRFPARPEYNVVVCHAYKKSWAADRREYYQTNEWKQKRLQKMKQSGFVCEICGSAINLQVHHLTYEHFRSEPMEDLIVLCAKCHHKLHSEDIRSKDVEA